MEPRIFLVFGKHSFNGSVGVEVKIPKDIKYSTVEKTLALLVEKLKKTLRGEVDDIAGVSGSKRLEQMRTIALFSSHNTQNPLILISVKTHNSMKHTPSTFYR